MPIAESAAVRAQNCSRAPSVSVASLSAFSRLRRRVCALCSGIVAMTAICAALFGIYALILVVSASGDSEEHKALLLVVALLTTALSWSLVHFLFALEYANREMAELELWSQYAGEREVAAGVIDVKSMYLETPEDVAERIRIVLKHVKPEKLYLTCDCGFSASSRGLARAKLNALVAGAAIVRKELTGKH